MKKIFLALAAAAALAACSKTEVDFTPSSEITFAPVAANRTKAMLSGTTFPDEQFNVWGYYKQILPCISEPTKQPHCQRISNFSR